MKDMTFQIEKAKVIRKKISEKDNTMKPRAAMLGLCDVILEVLAEMQDRQPKFAEYMEKRESPPDREIRHPLTVEDRRKEVMAMLNVCRNELQNKVLFPSLDQTEIGLLLKSGSSEIITRDASFLIQRIIETMEANR